MTNPNGQKPKGIVVFSGGSAANNLVDVFNAVRESRNCPLSYVIPISDNGGSSSELIRVFGGPGIGDVRSRLVRLIPSDPSHHDSEKTAIKTFFNHRLPKSGSEAKQEWLRIIDAEHPLWENISSPKKELIRSFLNHVNMEIVKRIRPSSTFDFSSASIGNLFLTGARLFTGSFESAIYLLSSICSVPPNISVLPAINTNFTHHISAGLADGTQITGQNAISHPSHSPFLSTNLSDSHQHPGNVGYGGNAVYDGTHDPETLHHDTIEDANLPGSLPSLRRPQIQFSKSTSASEDLPARIERIWYINPYGSPIRPPANPKVLSALSAAEAIIYSIGSLYTSIIPSLILRGVGERIAQGGRGAKWKVLILNSTLDRETGPPSSEQPFTATSFIAAIAKACTESMSMPGTHVVQPAEYKNFVTHVIHLSGDATPLVNRAELSALGIECVKVYGRRVDGEEFLRYDERALIQALGVLMGSGRGAGSGTVGAVGNGGLSRRNTLEG